MAITSNTGRLDWRTLPRAAQSYVVVVIAAGVCALLAYAPPLSAPPPMFLALLAASCLTSIWKVNLPIALASGATLSVSYAAHLTALLLLGPRYAVVVAVVGAWTQCTVRTKRSYPFYRTAFSMATQAITIAAAAPALPATMKLTALHRKSSRQILTNDWPDDSAIAAATSPVLTTK